MFRPTSTPEQVHRLKTLAPHALVLLAYALISLAFCWPLPARLNTEVAGRYVDARVFQWNNWWVKRAVLNGLDLDYTLAIYAPSGVSLVSHNFNWVSSFLSIPLDLVFGPLISYNLLFLLTFWGPACAMYALVLDRTRRRDAAFIAGLVFAFFPYHVSGNWDGQMNLANIQWLPLFCLFAFRALEAVIWRQRVRDALLAGLFFALSALDCWFFLPFLGLWGVVWLAHSLLAERELWVRPRLWRTLGTLALAGASALALMSPFLLPVLADIATETGDAQRGIVDAAVSYHADDKASDLLAFLVPGSDHPLFGGPLRSVYARFRHWRPAYLGLAALLLGLYAAVACTRHARLWLIAGLLFLSLSLGSTLTINGVRLEGAPTPYRLLTGLWPAFKIVRQANRFNVMVGLSLAVLVGIAWADLAPRLSFSFLRRPGSDADSLHPTLVGGGAREGQDADRASLSPPRALQGGSWTATLLLAVLLLFDYWSTPCPTQPGEVSPFYGQLAAERGDFVLLELPLNDFHSRASIYPQTVHGKRLVNGYVARMPPGTLAYIRSQPILRLTHLQIGVEPGLWDVERQLGLLAANDVRYVVLRKEPLPPQPPVDEAVMADWRDLFGPEVHYEDDAIAVYRLRLAPGQNTTPIQRLDDLGLAEVRVRRTWVLPPDENPEQWATVDLTWVALDDLRSTGSSAPQLTRTHTCRVTLLSPDGTPVTGLLAGQDVRISPRYPTSRWPEGVVVADSVALPLAPETPAGAYRLQVVVSEEATGIALAQAELPVQLAARPEPLVPALSEMAHPAGISYGGELRLLGYTTSIEESRLHVALYWLAEQAIHTQYKFFVHLVDDTDGTLAAQHDGMPRQWSYPTDVWGRGEVFVERITLDTSQAGPGPHHLAVGVYSVETGRLPALDRMGQRLPNDQAELGIGE